AVRVAALLDPQVLDVELLAVAVGPQEVGVALVHRHDVLVVDEGHHPLLLAPHPRAVGIGVAAVAVVEELDPGRRGAGAQGVHVVLDLEQVPARGAAVDDLPEVELPRASVDALKHRVVRHPAQYSPAGRSRRRGMPAEVPTRLSPAIIARLDWSAGAAQYARRRCRWRPESTRSRSASIASRPSCPRWGRAA